MTKRTMILVVISALTILSTCGWCVWSIFQPYYKDLGTYDIGEGRVVRIWAQGDDDWFEPGVGVYYQILQHDAVVVPTTYLGHFGNRDFQFKTCFADDNSLACVYDVNLAAKDSSFMIIYDSRSGESWPRLDSDEDINDPSVFKKWKRRYDLLKDANPEFPRIKFFEEPGFPRSQVLPCETSRFAFGYQENLIFRCKWIGSPLLSTQSCSNNG